MSEYQYYEFQAIDRPLRAEELAAVRACSSRARITSTSFINEYNWGDFKGDEGQWMARYYDAFLYVANWGTHTLKFRLPARLLDPDAVKPYCDGESMKLQRAGDHVVLTFSSAEDDEPEWEEGSGQLTPLLPIRDQLMRDDHRALYLGWLLSIQFSDDAAEALEPPVPPGLGRLGAALENLVEFLRVDTDLVDVAAVVSTLSPVKPPDEAELVAWLARQSPREKDQWLARFVLQSELVLPAELMQRFLRDHATGQHAEAGAERPAPRTACALLEAAVSRRVDRERSTVAREAVERVRRERELATARERHLDSLAGRETQLWRKINDLIASKLPKNYDQAVGLLVDLRDLAARSDERNFSTALIDLRATHSRKPGLMERLARAGL